MSRSYILILNTLATYARSVFSLALGLFSSRWILSALGESDYGLFSVVGSIIVFITFINGAMSWSAARHFAYAIGEGKTEEVRLWFNSSLSLHVCFATGLTLIGWPIGEYIISHYMTIPEGRMETAKLVFRISLISAFISMISVPFVGIFTAKQRIAELAVWGILQTVLTVSLAFVLTQIKGNLLLVYAVGMTCILCSIQLIMIARASFLFHECRLLFAEWFDFARIKRMTSFAAWNLIGILGSTLRNQGTAILLNIHFGTKVNAAYGISNQLSSATDQLSSAMMGAFSPEITTCEAQGDRKRMLSLAQSANKFGTILVLFFAIPLLFEMDYVLSLWLKTPPQHTASFCRLFLIMFLIDRLSSGYFLAVNAYGRVAAYQATLGSFLVITLPIAWLFIKLGYPPQSVGFAFIGTSISFRGQNIA